MTERAQLSGVSLCGTIRPDGSICGLPASIVGPDGMVCPAHAPKPATVLSREQIAQWRAEHMLAAHARELAESHEVLRAMLTGLHGMIDNAVLAPGSSAGGNDAQ